MSEELIALAGRLSAPRSHGILRFSACIIPNRKGCPTVGYKWASITTDSVEVSNLLREVWNHREAIAAALYAKAPTP